jgi:hypothetical protein
MFGRTGRCLVSFGWPARTDSGSQAPGTPIDGNPRQPHHVFFRRQRKVSYPSGVGLRTSSSSFEFATPKARYRSRCPEDGKCTA